MREGRGRRGGGRGEEKHGEVNVCMGGDRKKWGSLCGEGRQRVKLSRIVAAASMHGTCI